VIGNAAYTGAGIHALPGAAKDAEAVAAALRSQTSWRLTGLGVAANLDGTHLAPTVQRFFAEASPGDTLLFYFAGHGLTDKGEGYLLPTDYAPGGALGAAVSASALWSAIRASKASRILVVLDACRAGSFVLPADAMGATAEGLSSAAERKRVGLLAAA